jgi:DNA-binding transcriptional regulator YiaG
MPNIDSVFKTEIARIARKQIRAELSSLKTAVSQHRAHLASLRRELEALQREVKRVTRAGGKTAQAGSESRESADGGALRFRASGLASHRKRLGLSAADFGKLLGVSGQSVYKWEAGEVRPRRSQLEAIADVRKMGRREALAKLAEAE